MQQFANACLDVLNQPDPTQKVILALAIQVDKQTDFTLPRPLDIPDHPARPNDLALVRPGNVAKRKWGSEQGRLALLHAVAHIELNAIDLAFDMIVRFGFCTPITPDDHVEFCADWLQVGQEEAKHFGLITNLMAERGMKYGDLPVHGGMWDAAVSTRDQVDARLAIAPLVLEARGLDVTPPMIQKLQQVGDVQAASVLQVIYDEEINHVAIGVKWFHRVCQSKNIEPKTRFQQIVASRFSSTLKPPFNVEARSQAGLPPEFYQND